MAQAAFGFSVDVGLVSHLNVVVDTLDAAASGTADLAQFAPAASRLAEVTNAVRLLTQAGDTGLSAEEAASFVIDTAGLSYLAAKMPNVIFLAEDPLAPHRERARRHAVVGRLGLVDERPRDRGGRPAGVHLPRRAARHRGRVRRRRWSRRSSTAPSIPGRCGCCRAGRRT